MFLKSFIVPSDLAPDKKPRLSTIRDHFLAGRGMNVHFVVSYDGADTPNSCDMLHPMCRYNCSMNSTQFFPFNSFTDKRD